MASQTQDRGGNGGANPTDRARDTAAKAAEGVGDAVHETAGRVAGAIEDAAGAVRDQAKKGPRAVREYSEAARDRLSTAADYVREHDAGEMGRDAVQTAKEYPVASLLVLGAVVVGGSLLIAAMMQDDDPSGEPHKARGLTAAANGLGPKGAETLTRIRDAALSFVVAKTVDTVEEMFPGFREHFDKM